MSTEPSQSRVIVMSGPTANTNQVYHRDFPEVRADGKDPMDAANHLVNALCRAMDSALTNWRRQSMDNAIKDVEAFLARGA